MMHFYDQYYYNLCEFFNAQVMQFINRLFYFSFFALCGSIFSYQLHHRLRPPKGDDENSDDESNDSESEDEFKIKSDFEKLGENII